MISAKEAMARLNHVCRGQNFNSSKRYHVFIEGQPETLRETNSRLVCWWYEFALGCKAFDMYSGYYTIRNRVWTIVTDDKQFARRYEVR
ncbi:hypothetical protein EVC12_171 [Rhizobium phage RHph_I42]|nr:hypothetical protein EVC12_171 [Rhizobium phage RHph_I42]